MASTQDAWYISLLGLAEHFRTSNPPDIKSCIQCLQAVFNFKPPQRVEARTHLQLGNILLTHTKNIDLARTHLEQSVSFLLFNTSFKQISRCILVSPVILFLLHFFSNLFITLTLYSSNVNNLVEVGHNLFLLQWCLSQTINGFDDVKFEAASVLAELFEQQGQPTHSKPILRKAIELSQHSVYWHCRLIFQLAVSDILYFLLYLKCI